MIWLIKFAIFGLIAGAIARLIHPGRDPMNWFWTMILGMAGSLVGGLLAGFIGLDVERGLMAWLSAIAGSILLLMAYHYGTTKRTPQGRVGLYDQTIRRRRDTKTKTGGRPRPPCQTRLAWQGGRFAASPFYTLP
jgi:uncharacterized membrane protein YeaQ/YmgE (transglycosylase-associated protein family)